MLKGRLTALIIAHTYFVITVRKDVFFMEESKYAQLEPKQLEELNQLEEKLEVTLIAYKNVKTSDFTNPDQDESPIN